MTDSPLATRTPPLERPRPLHEGDALPANGNGNGRPSKLPTINGHVVDPTEISAEVEAMERRGGDRLGDRDLPSRPALRGLVPEDELGDGRHRPSDRARRELLLPRHRAPVPGDLRRRATPSPTTTGSSSTATPASLSPSRRSAMALTSGAAIRTPAAESARWRRCARRWTAPSAGSPESAGSTRRPGRAAAKFGWDKRFGLWKLNPLADWDDKRVWNHIKEHHVPYNPLHDQGYPSIGCMPCTSKPGEGEERSRRPLGRNRPVRVRHKWVAPRRPWR